MSGPSSEGDERNATEYRDDPDKLGALKTLVQHGPSEQCGHRGMQRGQRCDNAEVSAQGSQLEQEVGGRVTDPSKHDQGDVLASNG